VRAVTVVATETDAEARAATVTTELRADDGVLHNELRCARRDARWVVVGYRAQA
jgi:hypothetical protein